MTLLYLSHDWRLISLEMEVGQELRLETWQAVHGPLGEKVVEAIQHLPFHLLDRCEYVLSVSVLLVLIFVNVRFGFLRFHIQQIARWLAINLSGKEGLVTVEDSLFVFVFFRGFVLLDWLLMLEQNCALHFVGFVSLN